MSISLTPQTQKLVEEQMEKGGYHSPDDVVRAGLASLERHGDFEPDELERLLADGEADIERGNLIDGEEVFRQLNEQSAAHRKARQ
jgi:antitoxin ParD1/3/4